MKNLQQASSQLHKKLSAGLVEVEDLELAREVARGSGQIRDRVLFAKIKQELERKASAE